MMNAKERLLQFLDEEGIEYELVPVDEGGPRCGASPSRATVETRLLAIDSEYALAAFSDDAALELERLSQELATRAPVRVASEAEVLRMCAGWRAGALVPIGNLFGLLVYVSEDLAQEERIGFPAGDGRHAVHLDYVDFERLVKPCEVPLCTRDLRFRSPPAREDDFVAAAAL